MSTAEQAASGELPGTVTEQPPEEAVSSPLMEVSRDRDELDDDLGI